MLHYTSLRRTSNYSYERFTHNRFPHSIHVYHIRDAFYPTAAAVAAAATVFGSPNRIQFACRRHRRNPFGSPENLISSALNTYYYNRRLPGVASAGGNDGGEREAADRVYVRYDRQNGLFFVGQNNTNLRYGWNRYGQRACLQVGRA